MEVGYAGSPLLLILLHEFNFLAQHLLFMQVVFELGTDLELLVEDVCEIFIVKVSVFKLGLPEVQHLSRILGLQRFDETQFGSLPHEFRAELLVDDYFQVIALLGFLVFATKLPVVEISEIVDAVVFVIVVESQFVLVQGALVD